MKTRTLQTLAATVALTAIAAARAEDTAETSRIDEVVVTAPAASEPLTVVTDPKAPRQPVPAHDGADYLKNIPGFSVIRKGGTDGDPVLRGMAGSRLNILLDGEQILGGCGMRMDPPTAYVFPESYDRITVLKGPQSVLNGPGASAGTVLFERDIKRFDPAGWKAQGSLLAGSFGRHDEVVDARGGTPDFYTRAIATDSHSDDYEDGDGKVVHSRYQRWSINAAAGWTPDNNTRLELSTAASDGEAAYADRSMDGAMFKRSNYGLKFEKKNLSTLVDKIEAQTYYNYIDHVMDNYSLRSFVPSMMMPNPAVSNPDRETVGGRVLTGLHFAESTKATVGLDYQNNEHTNRSTMNQTTMPYENMARTPDASFRNYGLFGELKQFIGERDQVIAGLRADKWKAQDKRASITLGMGMSATTVANPTANVEREETLTSGFIRYEHDLDSSPTTVYAGLGHSKRFPDYWELISQGKESADTISAFDATRPERTTQLDVGALHKSGPWSYSVSGFYNQIDDYILIQSNVAKISPMRTVTITRNVDAKTWGAEAGAAYLITQNWKTDATLSWVRGTNESDGTSLAQLPPLEGRLGLTYDNKTWSVGSLLRMVAEQNHYDLNKGNIAGQDIGRTPGFSIFSVNASYRLTKAATISGGVDNLFDKTYAEHLSRSGAAVSGYTQTLQVNEPGRNYWLKASAAF
jgi:iron complex outermembrane receptor protein